MKEIKGDFWGEAERLDVSAIVCTINMTLKKDGTLVMGAGIAKQFAERMDWLPDRWGVRTTQIPLKTYPFVELMPGSHPDIVGIHTKFDWREPSPLILVDRSIKQLSIIAQALDWKKILMTKPGCGYGNLSWENQVKPIMEAVLNDRFIVIDQ